MTAPRILVVDDEKAVRSALTVNLGKEGFQVSSVQNAEEALAALQDSPVDMVISDVAMPGMGGIALLEQIKDNWPEVHAQWESFDPLTLPSPQKRLKAVRIPVPDNLKTAFTKPWSPQHPLSLVNSARSA